MPDTLHPYTVSAVVDTTTGELLGTPIVRPGHEDYGGFDTVEPLATTEQFRWVHVWAPTEAAAAASDALTADLRPDGERARPVARALSGEAGLKPYSVAAVVHTRTGRPIGEPVAAEGHHSLAGATFVGRRGTRSHTANVWAVDAADAIAQVFTTIAATNAAGLRSVAAARGDPPGPADVVALDAVAVAQREWNRLAGMPVAARAALVADTVWNREYPATYRTAYTAAAARVAAAATEAAASNPTAWIALHQLAAASGDALSRLAPDHPAPPPASHGTIAAAQFTAAGPGRQPPWQRVADVAAAGSRTAGTLAGALTATGDVLAGWRARSGHLLADGITVGAKPAGIWVADLLAAVNREIAAPVAAAVRTAAQLAREDQASTVSPLTVGPVSSRARTAASPAPASTTTRRTR